MEGLPITKMAINSTLGTDEFQPLDEILKGHKHLEANVNSQLKKICDSWASTSGSDTKTFTARTDGTISFTGSLYSASSSTAARITVQGSTSTSSTTIASVKGSTSFKHTGLNIAENETYTITLTYGTVDNFWICADVIDDWWIDVV